MDNNSYIQKTEFISKFHYESNKDRYKEYEKYPLEDKIIISKNENPFVSLYDIAFFCKKKYKKNKLFLIAHRFINKQTNDKFIEFFIFNTQNIFDKALTSYISVKYEELFEKRHLVQEMVKISQTLLDIDDLLVILGDNVKQHDILEYLDLVEEKEEKKVDLLKIDKKNVKFEKISNILNKVRILEPKEKKNKKIIYIILSIIAAIYLIPDLTSMLAKEYKDDVKIQTKRDRQLLRKLNKDVSIKLQESISLRTQTSSFSKKEIFKESKK